jgi:hypothetical protein
MADNDNDFTPEQYDRMSKTILQLTGEVNVLTEANAALVKSLDVANRMLATDAGVIKELTATIEMVNKYLKEKSSAWLRGFWLLLGSDLRVVGFRPINPALREVLRPSAGCARLSLHLLESPHGSDYRVERVRLRKK